MMEHEAAADGFAVDAPGKVVDFAHLDRGDVPIFRQPCRHRSERDPLVGRHRLDHDFGRRHDQVGLADPPLVAALKIQRRRHVGGISARCTAVHPPRDLRDLLLGERGIVFVVLDADVLLDVPGRHRAPLGSESGPRLDRTREWSRIFVGQQRHRRQGVGPMTRLTVFLQDRCDVFREGHVARRGRRSARLGTQNSRRGKTKGANDRCQLCFHRAHSRVETRETSIPLSPTHIRRTRVVLSAPAARQPPSGGGAGTAGTSGRRGRRGAR